MIGGAAVLDRETLLASMLRALPKERLVVLVQDVWSIRDIGARIAALRGTHQAPSNPVASLARLTRDQLIRLVLDTGMDEAGARREFDEYRFTQRPSLYLRAIPAEIGPNLFRPPDLADRLDAALATLNSVLGSGQEDPPTRDFRLEEVLAPDNDGLVEIRYSVQHRVDLVDPGDLRPRTEYSAALGAVWIDPVSRYCLINAGRATDADHLAGALASALEVGFIHPVTLMDELLSRVIDDAQIKSGAFVRVGGSTKPRSIRLSDDDLAKKTSYGELRADAGYRPTYGYYRHQIIGSGATSRRVGVGLTRRAGHIWIPYPLARAELVAWAKTFMRTVAEQQAHFLASDATKAVAARRDALVRQMPRTWNRPQSRDSLLALVTAVAECRTQRLKHYPVGIGAVDLARNLRSGLIAVQLEGICGACGQDTLYRCPTCDHARFGVDANDAFLCSTCATPSDLSVGQMTQCECGEEVVLDPGRGLTLYPSGELSTLVGDLLRVVNPDLGLDRYAFLVEGSDLMVLEDRAAPRVLRLTDVAEFGQPADFSFYSDDIQQSVTRRLDQCEAGLEKCAPFKHERSPAYWPCDSCSPREHRDRECLRTIVIDRVGEGKIEPHTGTEIGDLVFNITVDGQRLNVIAFGKGHGTELRSTTNEGRALLSQVWQWHDDENYQVIAVLSSAQVAQNMRLSVETMARYGRKSVLYLSRPEVERLLAQNVESGTDKGPSGGSRCQRR